LFARFMPTPLKSEAARMQWPSPADKSGIHGSPTFVQRYVLDTLLAQTHRIMQRQHRFTRTSNSLRAERPKAVKKEKNTPSS